MAKPTNSGNRALIIGVGDYRPPITKLDAVAADVREVGKLLKSPSGVFTNPGTKTLSDAKATRKAILDELATALSATADTVFVYLAGHGAEIGGKYYFLPIDADITNLAATAVSLGEIKSLFDASPGDRVFLWLDCCHSGGILKRRGTTDVSPQEVIQRELKVTQGSGKVILAACTEDQSAFESPTIGHGFFTHALIRGLQGDAKNARGEVTAASLHDFIDAEIGNDDQRPMFSGETKGRIVLMHYDSSAPPVSKGGSTAISTKKSLRRRSENGCRTLGTGCCWGRISSMQSAFGDSRTAPFKSR